MEASEELKAIETTNLEELTKAKKPRKKKKDESKKEFVEVLLVDLLHNRLLMKKMADNRWGVSKHHGSHYYPSIAERRAQKKVGRNNRKVAR